MNLTFEALAPDYHHRLQVMKIQKLAQAEREAKKLLVHRDRFLLVQHNLGVPALWTMPVFYRERPSFSTYFGNGDPLDKPTVDEPRGRGPFATWEDGVADALTLDHVTHITAWTWEMACWEWEKWNGFGVRKNHGRPSGYLWSGTDQYAGGKYVEDGVWSRGTWDEQLGTVILAKAIAALDPELEPGFLA